MYFRSVIGCHRSSSERVPRQVQSHIAMGVVLWNVPVLISCDDSRATATQRVVSQTGTKSFIQGVCFRLLARVRWRYFLITLGCCLTDISQVASGAMASANSYSKRVWFRNVSTAGPLVASCLAYLASHDIWRWTGCTVALYGMLEWCCADGLSA